MGYEQHPGEGNVIYSPGEYLQARRRPGPQRPPIPRVGDELFYRRHEGSNDLYRIEVVEVQSLEDMSDPNLFYFQTDEFGQPRLEEGRMVLARAFDPWPWVRFWWKKRLRETREARMRGSAGWLPLDWETRPQPTPPAFIIVGG